MRRSRIHGTRWFHCWEGTSDDLDVAAWGQVGMSAGRGLGRARFRSAPGRVFGRCGAGSGVRRRVAPFPPAILRPDHSGRVRAAFAGVGSTGLGGCSWRRRCWLCRHRHFPSLRAGGCWTLLSAGPVPTMRSVGVVIARASEAHDVSRRLSASGIPRALARSPGRRCRPSFQPGVGLCGRCDAARFRRTAL